jgi:hypothetical protein
MFKHCKRFASAREVQSSQWQHSQFHRLCCQNDVSSILPTLGKHLTLFGLQLAKLCAVFGSIFGSFSRHNTAHKKCSAFFNPVIVITAHGHAAVIYKGPCSGLSSVP